MFKYNTIQYKTCCILMLQLIITAKLALIAKSIHCTRTISTDSCTIKLQLSGFVTLFLFFVFFLTFSQLLTRKMTDDRAKRRSHCLQQIVQRLLTLSQLNSAL